MLREVQAVAQGFSIRALQQLLQATNFLANPITLPWNDNDAGVVFAPCDELLMEAREMARIQRIDGPTEQSGETQLLVVVNANSANFEDG